jgi:hypothetical protein
VAIGPVVAVASLSASEPVSPIEAFLQNEYKLIRTLSDVRSDVRAIVLATEEGMADPHDYFDCCCINTGAPDRRLIFAGTSPNLSFLFYEEGHGRQGARYLLSAYSTPQGLAGIIFTAAVDSRRRPTSFKKLKASLAEGEYCIVRGTQEVMDGVPMGKTCPLQNFGLTGSAISRGRQVPNARDRGVVDWRSVWRIELAANSTRGVPRSFDLRLQNAGEVTLRGTNAVFTIYVGDEVFGWAVDRTLQKRIFEIHPAEVVNETVWFRDFDFSDYRGNRLDSKTVEATLRAATWRTWITLVDLSARKPSWESNSTVWSNEAKFTEE